MLLIALAIPLYLVVIQQDVAYRRIPNLLPVLVMALGALRWIATAAWHEALSALLSSAVLFAFGALLFWRGFVGGGDVKLIAASAFLVGADYSWTFRFLFYMTFAGGILSLAVLVLSLLMKHGMQPQVQSQVRLGSDRVDLTPETMAPREAPPITVPYGVAIAAGAVLTLLCQIP